MLLNGSVLGLVRNEMPDALRAAAESWRIATLLVACGIIVLIVQQGYDAWFMRPSANALLTLGLTLYGRGLRRFYGLADRYWVLSLTLLTALGVLWFDVVVPSAIGRIVVASLCWLFIMSDTLRMLLPKCRDKVTSQRVMVFIYVTITVFTAARIAWLLWLSDTGISPLDTGLLVNVITPLVLSVLPVIGTTAFLLMCSDRIRRDWEVAASTDYLTGLPNRRALAEGGERLLRASRESKTELGLAVLDIDYFKRINDQYGHDVGDEALLHVAALLRKVARTDDLIVRQGGEEFVVLLVGSDKNESYQRMEDLRAIFTTRAFISGEHTVPLTVSIGLTWLDEHDSRVQQMLHRADAALYRAKKGGRNRVEIADPQLVSK